MGTFQTYKITDAAGVLAHVAVVRDTTAGSCKKPAAAKAGKVIGITAEAQPTQNKAVAVQTDGPAYGLMYGSGSYGDALEVADTTGRLQSCQAALEDLAETTAYVTYIVGYAEEDWTATGDLIRIMIRQSPKLTPVT